MAEFKVSFQKNAKGKLYAKVCGKYYFPDKDWADVTYGPATVHIVKSKEHYGFVTGVMDSWESNVPSIDAIVSWAKQMKIPMSVNIFFISHPQRGKYVAMLDTVTGNICRLQTVGDDIFFDTSSAYTVQTDIVTDCPKKVTSLAKLDDNEDFKLTTYTVISKDVGRLQSALGRLIDFALYMVGDNNERIAYIHDILAEEEISVKKEEH